MVADQLEKTLSSKTTEDEIKQALDQVCGFLPGQFSDECKQFVDQYTPMVIDLLIHEVTPQQLCSLMGLCPGSKKIVEKKTETGDFCGICVMVADQLEKTLSSKTTEDEIKQALDQVCGFLPGQFSDECKQFVDQYTPMVIDLLTHEVTPQQLCSLMGLCSGSKKIVEKKTQSGEYCGICVMVAGQLEKTLSSKTTQDEIEQALDQVCGFLPGQFSDECKQFVDQYTPMVIALLTHEVTPQQLCALMGLCPGSKNTSSSTAVNGDALCELCDVVVQKVEDYIMKNSTEKQIRAALSELCTLLPHTITQECQGFVDLNLDMIMQLLVKEVSPDHVCSAIAACSHATKTSKVLPTHKTASDSTPSPASHKQYQDGTGCDVCKLLIEAAEQEISANSTEEEIETALKKACSYIPGKAQQFCKDVINEYVPEIVDAIVSGGDPLTVCTKAGLCSAKKRVLVGANPCTFGPSFWCANKTNAQLCNAVGHCMKHVW